MAFRKTTTPLGKVTPAKVIRKALGPSKAQLQCESKGGRWDKETKTCIMPAKEIPDFLKTKDPFAAPEQTQPIISDVRKRHLNSPLSDEQLIELERKETLGKPEVEAFTDVKTGQPSGIMKDGNIFLGGSASEIRAALEREAVKTQLPAGIERAGTAQAQAEQEEIVEAERQRLITEETPQRRELDPTVGFGERIPILGGLMSFSRKILGEPLKKALGIKSIQGLELTPEIMRTVALTEIEKQEIERGLTANEKFGAFVEAIPLVGSLAQKWAGGLIETPSENAREVKSNILKERRRITNIETNVKLGYLPVSVAQEQITDIENNIQRLESRIKLLINNSPELRFNSDYVNTVETEILATREKAFQAKQNILTGATQDPTEIQLLQQLKLTEEEE